MTRTLATLATVAALSLTTSSIANAGHCHRSRHHHHHRVVRVVQSAPIYVQPAPIIAPPPVQPIVIAPPAPLPLIASDPQPQFGPAPAVQSQFGPLSTPQTQFGPAPAVQSQFGPVSTPQTQFGPAPAAQPFNSLRQPRFPASQAVNGSFQTASKTGGISSLSAQLDALAQAGPAGLDPSLVPMVGNWEAMISGPNGTSQRILLTIQGNGMATLSIPTSNTGSTTLERRLVLKDRQLSLVDGSESMSLGRLVQSDADQMILERSGGRLSFVRK